MDAKDFTVRLGKPNQKDRESFIKLWKEFLIEHAALGADIEPSDENLLEFLRIYDSYTQGSLFGLTVLAFNAFGVAQGTCLVGEQPGGFNIQMTKPGRLAFVWGVYVKPEARRSRLSSRIQAFGVPELCSMGFSRVRSMVLEGYPVGEANSASWGAAPVATVVERDISKASKAGAKLSRKGGESGKLN